MTECLASEERITGTGLDAMAGVNTHALVLASLAGRKGTVADLGAGQGALTVALSGLGFEVYACDASVDTFKAHGVARVQFSAADLNERFPYTDAFFDGICAVEVIEHLENPRHFLRECHRILRPGGTIILTTPNVLNIASALTLLFKGHLIYFSQREYLSNRHITPLRLQDLQNMFTELGFRLARTDFNVGKVPIPKIRHRWVLKAKPFRNRWLGESLIVWAIKEPPTK